MPIHIQCPNCLKAASLPDNAAGKSVKCACGTILSVPLQPADMTILDDVVVGVDGISEEAQRIRAQREQDEAKMAAAKAAVLNAVTFVPKNVMSWFNSRAKSKAQDESSITSGTGPISSLSVCPKCAETWLPDARFCVKCAWDSTPGKDVIVVPKPATSDPSLLTSCPACGASWQRFQIQCQLCNFDVLKGRRIAPVGQAHIDGNRQKQRFLILALLGCLGVILLTVGVAIVFPTRKNRNIDYPTSGQTAPRIQSIAVKNGDLWVNDTQINWPCMLDRWIEKFGKPSRHESYGDFWDYDGVKYDIVGGNHIDGINIYFDRHSIKGAKEESFFPSGVYSGQLSVDGVTVDSQKSPSEYGLVQTNDVRENVNIFSREYSGFEIREYRFKTGELFHIDFLYRRKSF